MSDRREGWYWCVMDGALFPIYYSGGMWWKEGHKLWEEPRIISGRIPSPEDRNIEHGWMQAIDEALVTTHLGTAETSDSYEAAKRKLGELIDWHVAVALDERVNGGWRLVPAEATPPMSGIIEQHMDNHGDGAIAWRAALLAAPKP